MLTIIFGSAPRHTAPYLEESSDIGYKSERGMVEALCKRVVNRTLEMPLVAGTPRFGESGHIFGNFYLKKLLSSVVYEQLVDDSNAFYIYLKKIIDFHF